MPVSTKKPWSDVGVVAALVWNIVYRSSMLADTVLMVRPKGFRANRETFSSNAFQREGESPEIEFAAVREHEGLLRMLEDSGICVLLLEPDNPQVTPDAVFPNNWFSTHRDGTLVLYPMAAPSRRHERRADLSQHLSAQGYEIREIWDISEHEQQNTYLEGTGSLVLDRDSHIAYACVSVRTDTALAQTWATRRGYELELFSAFDPQGLPIYHTNVMLAIGDGVAVICPEVIPDKRERRRVLDRLANDREILEISLRQLQNFAGNQLFLAGSQGQVVVLSEAADASLSNAQQKLLDRYAQRIVAAVPTIERHGGGSVRCMLAEIFLPKTELPNN